jgi:hypothetical protein
VFSQANLISKTIDIFPSSLLPIGTQITSVSKKWIDSTDGLNIAGRDLIKNILREAENHILTQSDHHMVRDRALCAHVEIETDTASAEETRSHLTTWCVAGFQKQ